MLREMLNLARDAIRVIKLGAANYWRCPARTVETLVFFL